MLVRWFTKMEDVLIFQPQDLKETKLRPNRLHLMPRLFHNIVVSMKMNNLQSLTHGNQEFVEMLKHTKVKTKEPILLTVLMSSSL